jgi:hypothetical protein
MSRHELISILYALLAACQGCRSPPTQLPITVTGLDGSSLVVSVDTACATAARLCAANSTQCSAAANAQQGGAPIDLVCATTASSPAALNTCVGFQGICPDAGP